MIRRDGHWEHYPVESKAFGDLLAHRHYIDEGKAPSGTALDDLARQYRGQALFEGEERDCFVRLGEAEGKLYLDLGAPDWSAAEIDANGWRVVAEPPVKLRRPNSARALPEPEPGAGDIALLRRFANVETEIDFRLAVAWLLGCLHPTGPYPLMILAGEQGSAKSSTAKALRRLIDPAEPESRSSPGDERDLVIAATNSRVLSFDNLSTSKPSIADAFFRLATGGGFGTRKLHTNDEEMLFNATRPCLLNGIPDLASRPDLADRAIILNLPVISEAERRYEDNF